MRLRSSPASAMPGIRRWTLFRWSGAAWGSWSAAEPLDGGRIFFLLVDAVAMLLFRRRVPEKYQAAVNTIGFVVLMGFMLLVTLQDVWKLIR